MIPQAFVPPAIGATREALIAAVAASRNPGTLAPVLFFLRHAHPPYFTPSHIVKYDRAAYCDAQASERSHAEESRHGERDQKMGRHVEGVRWHDFTDVRLLFRDADYVNGYVVFNIGRNCYRLITVIHYAKTTDAKRTEGHVYIRSLLTHKDHNDLHAVTLWLPPLWFLAAFSAVSMVYN
jgi:mRNA-degrading endonuclease HigB of HigAB toxin-antitoxin module